MKYKYEHLGKDNDKKSDYSRNNQSVLFLGRFDIYKWNLKSCSILVLVAFVFFWTLCSLFGDSTSQSFDENLCYANFVTDLVCNQVNDHKITGNLCLDICITKSAQISNCIDEAPFKSNFSYKYYLMPKSESNVIYTESNETPPLSEGISFDEFTDMITNVIKSKINDSITVEKILNRIMFLTDANKDQNINFQEANSLWKLVNNKPTFYMLALASKSYMPKIKNVCGSFVEIEEIRNDLTQKRDFFFASRNYWYKIDPIYRAKISLGILEFFMDAPFFNPNDEFGVDSLHLCSRIENSFAYTFLNEAKLVNFDHLLNAQEIIERLNGKPSRYSSVRNQRMSEPAAKSTVRSQHRCSSDLDCAYSGECSFKCDTETKKCDLSRPVKPQLTLYCEFLENFFTDKQEIMLKLKPLINRCLNLNIHALADSENARKYLSQRNEMPLNYENVKDFVLKKAYWMQSDNYSELLQDMHFTLWDMVRLSEDPKKPIKKKKTKETTNDDKIQSD